MNKHLLIVSSLCVIVTFSGCAQQPLQQPDPNALSVRAELANERQNAIATNQNTSSDSAAVEIPATLTSSLLSLTEAPQQSRFDISVSDRFAQDFFADLSRSQNINLLVDPSINDRISLRLRNVNLNQVFMALRDIYGYDFEKTSYGYKVNANQISTRVYQINYLNVIRSGESITSVSGDSQNQVRTATGSTGSTGSSSESQGFWQGLQQSVNSFIRSNSDDSDTVIVNAQTGLLIVRATGNEHAAIQKFLSDAELILQKQVIIEAKIVEVTLSNEFSSGINWELFDISLANSTNPSSSSIDGNALPGFGSVGGVFNFSVGLNNFNSMLQLLDHQGDVQVLSSPRVSTLNNQKAVIKVGTDEYFATNIAAVPSDEGDDNNTSQNTVPFTLEQFFSGIALDVTPQISNDNSVTLHVRPTVTDVVERTKVINVGDQSYALPLAYSNVRETDSIIRAQNGQIIVIGGLLQQKQDNNTTGLPWLAQLPVVKYFFSQERRSNNKSELVILLKPTVYEDNTSLNDIDAVLNRLR